MENTLQIYTEIVLYNIRYRANPNYRGSSWYDWAFVRFELTDEERIQQKYNKKHNITPAYPPGYYPSKLLTFFKVDNELKVLIHCTETKKHTRNDSCLTERYHLEYYAPKRNRKGDLTQKPIFRIVDVKNIHDRAYVVEQYPGVHGEIEKEHGSNLVIHVKKRNLWSKYFTDT